LAGDVRYDLPKLCAMWRPYLGPRVQLTGAGSGPWSVQGPLDLARLQGATGLTWESALIYGFPIGPGQLKARLADGVLRAEPMDLDVSQGRLLLAPQVRLAPAPMELTMPAGPVAKQVQITPEMCAAGLKFIAPILAEVTAAQGSFSIDLEACRIPLADPASGDVTGRFTVHSVEVGPGPLVRELALVMNRESAARLKQESVMPFRMVGGRVYHQGLELVFPEVTVRTHGSVGIKDQSLALMAEMPVPPKWIGANALGAALKDQVIRLPIAGTLNRPQLDRRELDKTFREVLQRTTRSVLGTEINKQLERLLGPRRE